MRLRNMLAVLLCLAAATFAQEAPYAYQPPEYAAAATAAGLPPAAAERYLDAARLTHEYQGLWGQNHRLKAESLPVSPLKIGERFPVELEAPEFFAAPVEDEGGWVHSAALRSLGAHALRVQVDLSGLAPHEEVWALDPVVGHAFGPFTRNDHHADGFWLPTVQGDAAVIAVRTAGPQPPDFRVAAASHQFFDEYELKQLWCNLTLADVDDPELYALASGVGRLSITKSNGTFACSGSLVNNPQTAEFEPYFLTAYHCIGTNAETRNTEVFWDYRSASDSLGSLPRSRGSALLGTSANLDITLIQLNSVPSGPHGRVYAGWSTATPQIGNAVSGLHHPRGSYMRASFGSVLAASVSVIGYSNQIRVGWDEGVTEGGSSGSPLFDAQNRLIGVLSNGPVHVCGGTPQENHDQYASFRLFFPQVQQYLNNASPPPPSGIVCAARGTASAGSFAADVAVLAFAVAVLAMFAARRPAHAPVRCRKQAIPE